MYLPVLLLIGAPKVGKSSIVRKVVGRLPQNILGGFYTNAIIKDGHRVGFEIVTITGKRRVLSIKTENTIFRRSVHFKDYCIDLDAIDEIAVPTILESFSNHKIIVIDEIGPMQLFSEKFHEVIRLILDKPKVIVFGTIVQQPHEFADYVKFQPRVWLKVVNIFNRDVLPDDITTFIKAIFEETT